MCEEDRHIGLLLNTFSNHGFLSCPCSSTYVHRNDFPRNGRFTSDVEQTYSYGVVQTPKGPRCTKVSPSDKPAPEFYAVSTFDRRQSDHKLRPVHPPRPIVNIKVMDPRINTNIRAKLAFRYAKDPDSIYPVAVGVRYIKEDEEEQYL